MLQNTINKQTEQKKDANQKPLVFKKIQIRRVRTNIVGGIGGLSTSRCGGEGCCG